MQNKTKKIIYRSSKTGKIVTEKYAKSHPSTTEKETMKITPKKKINK